MVFSSTSFLCFFLPITLLLYFACPKKLRNGVLFAVSLIFYAWGEPVYVLIMLFSTVFDYMNGILIGHFRRQSKEKLCKAVLIVSMVGNLAILGFFKYTDFLLSSVNSLTGASFPLLEIALPIGISFYTFQTMSYTIDVYRGIVRVQHNIISFGAYVTLFPQLIAGPIVKYKDVQDELESRHENLDDFASGVRRFVLGLGKKVLLANRAGAIYEQIKGAELSVSSAWLGAVMFAFQIYFDFSGYSDMAIGLGRMLGFRFNENFNDPYTAVSVTDFWRRWHISLGTWFKEYVYIPLGGNKKGLLRQIVNISVVWLLTGLWHGASLNFVLWGAYFGVLLILEKSFLLKLLDRLPKFAGRIYTMFCVLISWVIFANDKISDGLSWIDVMFGEGRLIDNQTIYIITTHVPLLIVCLLMSSSLPRLFHDRLKKQTAAYYPAAAALTAAVLVVSMAFLVADTYNPFLYFRF